MAKKAHKLITSTIVCNIVYVCMCASTIVPVSMYSYGHVRRNINPWWIVARHVLLMMLSCGTIYCSVCCVAVSVLSNTARVCVPLVLVSGVAGLTEKAIQINNFDNYWPSYHREDVMTQHVTLVHITGTIVVLLHCRQHSFTSYSWTQTVARQSWSFRARK